MTRDEVIESHPFLDIDGKFMAFANTKCGSSSMSFYLGPRIVRWRRGREWYLEVLSHLDIDNIFKFAIARNPWDRAVSAFFFLQQHGYKKGSSVIIHKDVSFKEFIIEQLPSYDLTFNISIPANRAKKLIQEHFKYQYIGKEYADFIARLETIDEDWKYIAQKIDCGIELPHHRKSEHRQYRDYYDEESEEAIHKIFNKDIELLGYTF